MAEKLGPAYTVDHRPERAMPRLYVPVSNLLKAAGLPALFRHSRGGVPHLVLDIGVRFSVCWMGRGQFFRVFHPYPSPLEGHVKHDTATPEGVLARVKAVLEGRV